jgi:putative FmdB family regulatory protein
MPIYAYKCGSCGHAKDVLQKISDTPLDTCPACGAVAFTKQVTAAGFQLKGSGWYATDFRNGSKPASTTNGDKAAEKTGDKGADKADTAKPADTTSKPADSTPSVTKSDPPVASAGGCAGGCACH